MLLDEKYLKEKVKPHILRCRPGDWEHSKRVARWVTKLGASQKTFHLILVAAYVHDIGWRDLVSDEKITFDQLLKLEPQANENSELFVREVLGALDYPEDEIKTVLRLVMAADSRESNQDDEAVIVDSDALSKLDIGHLKEKYQQSEWLRLYKVWVDRLPKKIRTKQAKKEYPKLLKNLKEDINKELEK